MQSEIEQRLRAVMADVFAVEASVIGPEWSRETHEQWDSVGHINLVFALETEFGVGFEVAEIESILTYRDLLEVLEAKV